MKLSVMREYVHLCGTKNYSKTAEELYIDQSALSRHIMALEKEMGAQLIERTKNSFQLTEAGKLVEAQFKRIPNYNIWNLRLDSEARRRIETRSSIL